MTKQSLTQSRLKKLLHYNSATGVFTWLIPLSHYTRVGRRAGYHRSNGYFYIKIDKTSYLAHRLGWLDMTGDWPKHEIDHIDGDPSNNKFSNLRDVTHRQNQLNLKLSVASKSGVAGVNWHTRDKRWIAKAYSGGNETHLGSYTSFFEAVCTRKAAEIRFGYHENHGSR